MNRMRKGAALLGGAAAIALALSACGDAEAVAKAEAAAKAKSAAAREAKEVKDRVAHQVDCLTALRWQKPVLSTAGIGDVGLYETHFRARLEDALGSTMLEGEGGAPMLSRANTEDYVNWAYGENVRTKFAGGGDGGEGRGVNIVTACINEVAEAGKGPLAGNDKVARAARIQGIRTRLKNAGA